MQQPTTTVINPRRRRDTVTADEVIAYIQNRPNFGGAGARRDGIRTAVRTVRIAIDEICAEGELRCPQTLD